MKLTFFGAARAVTGSCHCLECNGRKYLVDCGLQQGRDEIDNRELDFHPGNIDAVIVTHAHIDHSGRLPLLIKQGFLGNIYCTRLTAKLLSIMLLDSAHIQESDAQWQNQKGRRAGKEAVEPLYTIQDAQETLTHLVPVEYGQRIDLAEDMQLEFVDAGHLLGSAVAQVWATEAGTTRKIVFSGDLGNLDQPVIRDPQPVPGGADYVVTESTYGDRLHDEVPSYKEELAQIIDTTLSQGGNVIIPAFAVGRTQELLYYMREIKEEGLCKLVPNFEVVVDSPLASEATEIFSGDLTGYLDEDAIAALKRGGNLFRFPDLYLTETVEESKALNADGKCRVILSASGMCDAGRIRHHLKHNLWRSECTVVFVGYQAEGSLGRRLLDGTERVKLFGEEIMVRAQIRRLEGLSSHADQNGLLSWIDQFNTPELKQVFVVHGDQDVTSTYAGILRERGFAAHAPDYEEVYDLLTDRVLAPGIPPAVKEAAAPVRQGSPAYRRLEETGEQLLTVIKHNMGGTNKDLGKFADQLRALIKKWDR